MASQPDTRGQQRARQQRDLHGGVCPVGFGTAPLYLELILDAIR